VLNHTQDTEMLKNGKSHTQTRQL